MSKQTVYIERGKDATFGVTITGSCDTFEWRRQQKIIKYDDKYHCSGNNLTVTNVEAQDDGSYTVYVSNKYGINSKTFQIKSGGRY